MRLLSQVQTLDETLAAWQRYQQIPFETFDREKDTQYMVCHAMLLAIQASIDLATGMAVAKTPKRPDSYRETFYVLGKSGIIPEELATGMARLAGFRNILVHEYTGLDTRRVHGILMEDWQTMDRFRGLVKKFIRDQEKPGE
ncbi:type VII toxin-antitoxin system HepT family RNase toxin [Methanoregula sp. UBA64]|jgi:uncharacterized protein YutE (UPF0331/DUF86 family)|uniref:type VII toxin-antitoxin system HepT family RNase toxin n=1 Tax=Methanoregula sp. UBA64 TaxID=1915554 RepID=UPI0025F67AB5|nr:DUF86 domain-containing protein [Methanoregula sp. UBA64]